MDPRMIAPAFLAEALQPLRLRGLDPAPLLAQAGIGGLDQPVTAAAFGQLWREIARVTGDEFFGLAARPMPPGGFAMIAHGLRDVTVLEVGLHRALRFLAVMLGRPEGQLRVESGLAVITLRGSDNAFAQRTYWILLHGLACWLAGRRLPIRGLSFAGAAPVDGADYRQFFGVPVRFGAPEGRLELDAAHLALPVSRSPAQLRAFLRGAPANILVRYRQDQGVVAAVRRQFGLGDWPDAATIAARLALPESTLRHRLKAEGTSLRAQRDAARQSLALHALQQGRAVADLAADLGFAEPSAFHRAFRGWTGSSPGQWRRAHAGPASGDLPPVTAAPA